MDGEWLVDPSKEVITDETGNQNNVVVVENRLGKVLREVGSSYSLLVMFACSPF